MLRHAMPEYREPLVQASAGFHATTSSQKCHATPLVQRVIVLGLLIAHAAAHSKLRDRGVA